MDYAYHFKAEIENRVLRKALAKLDSGSEHAIGDWIIERAYDILDSDIDNETHRFMRYHPNRAIRMAYLDNLNMAELVARDIACKIFNGSPVNHHPRVDKYGTVTYYIAEPYQEGEWKGTKFRRVDY